MSARPLLKLRARRAEARTAQAYDCAGAAYRHYADGPSTADLFAFAGPYAYSDRRIWRSIESVLVGFAEAGMSRLTVVDAGCGPGTWLLRVVTRARLLGIPEVEALGFDLSGEQIAIAQQQVDRVRGFGGVTLRFEQRDITAPFPEADASVDLCLSLYGVLNHVPVTLQAKTAAELARVTRHRLIVTARTTGSLPSIFIDRVDAAADFHLDNREDRLVVDLKNGRHVELDLHLFHARDLEALFAPHIDIARMMGLDIFHSRFAPDPRWNPAEGPEDDAFHRDLEALEQSCAGNPHFMDHATHVLLVAEPQMFAER